MQLAPDRMRDIPCRHAQTRVCQLRSVISCESCRGIPDAEGRRHAISRRNNNNYSRYGGGGGGMRLWFDPTDILWYWDPFYYQRRRERRLRGEGMSFVESIFSFVFGDGDPNVDFEERRWQAVCTEPSGCGVLSVQLAGRLRSFPSRVWVQSKICMFRLQVIASMLRTLLVCRSGLT